MSEPKPKAFEQWCVVEIMGHQSVVGRCSEEQIAGATLLRVDVPDSESFTTQYVGGGLDLSAPGGLRGGRQKALSEPSRQRAAVRLGATAACVEAPVVSAGNSIPATAPMMERVLMLDP